MRRAIRAVLVAVTAALAMSCAAGTPPGGVSRAEHRLADRAVPDIPLRLADDRVIRLSDLAGEKPLLITFFYRRCTGICTPFLEWVRDAVREVGGLGADYRVLALSFDDADTVADLRAQASALGLLQAAGWSFAVAEREALARVTGALEFWYRRDPATRQYDHSALLVAVERGRVVRALLGSPDDSQRFRELVWELRGAFIASYRVPGQTPLACLTFDPRTGQTRLDWGLLLLALPALAAMGAAMVIFLGTARGPRSSSPPCAATAGAPDRIRGV